MARQIYQNFKISIAADNSKVSAEPTFDQRARRILGFGIFSKRMDQVDLRGSFRMEIDGGPVFPEGTDTKEFTTNASVPVGEKIFYFKEPMDVGSRSLLIEYSCKSNPLTPFAVHDVIFKFILE